MLRLELEDPVGVFRPGAGLRGVVSWDTAASAVTLKASLGWHTEGKGDEDAATVVEQQWLLVGSCGSQAFQWRLPRGPLSAQGKLLRIRWVVACSIAETGEDARVEIVLSPTGQPIAYNNS
jgi:hypothetical protein